MAEAEPFSALAGMKIPVADGRWTFRLSAKYGESEYSAECQTSIEPEKITPLSFELSPSYKYGGLKLNFAFTGKADKAELLLMEASQNTQLESKSFENFSESGGVSSFTYERGIKDDTERLTPGSYLIIVKFYANGLSDPLNVYEDYIRIASDKVTAADIELDLNEAYTIQYELNGGEAAGATFVNKVSRKSGTLTIPPVTKEGYIFAGWYTDEELTKEFAFSSAITKSLTLFAKWGYGITYETDGGSFTSSPASYYTQDIGVDLPSADEVTKANLTFVGWYETASFSGEAVTSIESGSTGNKTFYARWLPKLSFQTNGGCGEIEEILVTGGTATEPDISPLDGCDFKGWYSDKACTNRFDFSSSISENTTLYAKWAVTLIKGEDLNVVMKKAAGDSSATRNKNNTNATSFGKSSENHASSYYLDASSIIPVWLDDDGSSVYYYNPGCYILKLNEDSSYIFYGFTGLREIYTSDFDTSTAVYLKYFFAKCSSLTSIDVSGFDFTSAESIAGLFQECSSLNSIDVSTFVLNNITDISYLFYKCSSLTSIDVTNFNTSKVTNMGSLFENCERLTTIDVSSFDTSNVTKLNSMFYGCTALQSIDLSNFRTGSLEDMNSMFYNCKSLTVIDLSTFETSKVSGMMSLFYGCSALTTIYVSASKWTTAAIESYVYGKWTFAECTNLVGGNGTVYNSEHDNYEYARIDSAATPGYLTAK